MKSQIPTRNWDDIRYFLAVARTGTLSAAAERLGTEHTTVGRHIRSLEEELQTRLFHKTNQGYELSAAGERLLASAEAMEGAYVAARSTAQSESRSITGTVRIGAPDGFGTVFLAPRLHLLVEKYPGLEIELLATARLFSLSKREADIAISLAMPQQMRVISKRLTDYRLHLYATRAYLDRVPPILAPADLEAHPFVSYIEDLLFTPELNYLSAVGVKVDARIRSTNLLAQVNAVVAGAGLCILPTFIAAAHEELVAVLPDKIALKRSFYLHIHEDNRKAAHVKMVADFITSEVERGGVLFHSHPGEIPHGRPQKA